MSLKNNYLELTKNIGGPYSLMSKGIKRGLIDSIMRGSMPSLENAYLVAKTLGVSLERLLTGEEAAPSGMEATALKEGYEYIPLYDIQAAAGGGAFPADEEVKDLLAFRRDWLVLELKLNPKDLSVVQVEGDSMTPTLNPGDILLILRDHERLHKDGIYVVSLEGAVLVKRLQKLPGNVLKIKSDNPNYEPFTLSLAEEHKDFRVIGRVVWAGKRY